MDSPEALTSEAPKTVPADPATTSGRKLDRSLVHSLAWRAAGDWASQIFSWGSLLIIVRLLVPSDFGMVAMAVIFFPFLRQISEFGIPRIIVTFRDLSDEHIAELNTVGALLGGFSFLLACAAAKPIAIFFKTPPLVSVIIVLVRGQTRQASPFPDAIELASSGQGITGGRGTPRPPVA